MWNQEGDDPVPTMGDFNRERRFFRISEVIEFATTSVDKYEALSSNKEDEFEDYNIKEEGKDEIKPA